MHEKDMLPEDVPEQDILWNDSQGEITPGEYWPLKESNCEISACKPC